MGFHRRASQAIAAVRTYRNPLPRVLEYYGFARTKRPYLIHLRNGLRFSVRPGTSDFGVLDDVFMRGVYNRALEHIKRGDLVVDIGAQCGAFAVAAASRGARVLCYEPLPDNTTALYENARLNGCEDRVTVEESAVAAQPGTRTLHVATGDTGGATFFPAIHPAWSNAPGITQVSVPCVTLGEIFASRRINRCDCLKMDCEGAEYEIVAEVSPSELEKTKMIILEYHPNGDIGAMGGRLRDIGFAVEIAPNRCILLARRPE